MAINFKRLMKIAHNIALENNYRPFNHVSLITDLKGREILSCGTNSDKTHPIQRRLGYAYDIIHSECHALTKLARHISIEDCLLFNFCYNNKMQLRLSKPCHYCLAWCVRFHDIYYSNKAGIIVKLNY